jgi:hypothetical protein
MPIIEGVTDEVTPKPPKSTDSASSIPSAVDRLAPIMRLLEDIHQMQRVSADGLHDNLERPREELRELHNSIQGEDIQGEVDAAR